MENEHDHRRDSGGPPQYSEVTKTPNRGLPSDLTEQERGEAFERRCAAIGKSLREPARRPSADKPLFVVLLDPVRTAFLTMTLPEHGLACVPIFSSPFRATDYARVQLERDSSARYLSSSPAHLVGTLANLRAEGVEPFALDPCPRCGVLTAIRIDSIETADDVVECWTVFKTTEMGRMDLYLRYAQEAARAGDLAKARDVVFETVAHVSFEDPRAHLLLGQIALALDDRETLREAREFLRFFERDSYETRLDEMARSGRPDFELTA